MNKEELFKEIRFRRPLPSNFHSGDEKLFWTNEQTAWPIYYDTLANVTINHELFIKHNLSKILPISFGHPWQNDQYNNIKYLIKNGIKDIFRPTIKLDEVVWFLDQFSTGGYYHWLTEILPRLWIANEVKNIPKDIPIYIPEYFFTKWNFGDALLKPFGRKYFKYGPGDLLKVKNLHFISQSGGPLNFQPTPLKGANKVLLDYYYQSDFPSSYEKIYISRNKGKKRLLMNEDEIIPILQRHGYKIIYTEEMSISDQINIFSRVKSLISIHGAGLTNMVFMPEGAKILEIRNPLPDHMNNCFLSLADTMGHNYYYFLAKVQRRQGEQRDIDCSLIVDIAGFEKVLTF
jgi:capsular polysaccharide biosynthesis protein